jgi:hypothetical protein
MNSKNHILSSIRPDHPRSIDLSTQSTVLIKKNKFRFVIPILALLVVIAAIVLLARNDNYEHIYALCD